MSCHRNFKIIRYASLKIVYQRIVFIIKCNIYICPDFKEDESFIYFNKIVIVEHLMQRTKLINAKNRDTMFPTTVAFWKSWNVRMKWLNTAFSPISIEQNEGNFLHCSGKVAPRHLSNYSFMEFICCITILCLM